MIALLVAGILLIGAEVFVPGAVLGVMGSVALVGAIIMAFAISPVFGLYIAGAVIILTAIGVMVWIKFFPRLSIGKSMTLETDGKSFKSSDTPHPEVGQQGIAQSDLRPAGFALINGHREDVITEGGMINKGTPITVVQVAGNRIVVRKAE
jgi:membrane-bound serine protease (ClpP class)